MPAPANLIHETSSTTGTGNLTTAAVNGKIRFSDSTYGFGTGGTDAFWYFISNRSAAEWEIGTGHMSDASTLVRDTVVFSSNSNSAVNFSAGTKDITNDVPAGQQVRNEGSTVTSGHGAVFSGTTGRLIASLGAVPLSIVGLQVFTSSGTYTPTSGMKYCLVISTGGGGGGGGTDGDGSNKSASGGGGAGGTCIELFSSADIGASQSVTIGAGGTAGSASGGTDGGTGGNTTFGALHTANGGSGGAGSGINGNQGIAAKGGVGGTGSGGALNITGGAGINGAAQAQAGGDFMIGGTGGASFWGGGGLGAALSTNSTEAGGNGAAYGSGGGGSASGDSTAGAGGGAGAAGVVFVLEFG